jgi:hypothetical protein
MGQNFIAADRDQAFLMPPDLRDWVEPGHLAWFVVDAVGELDLAAFMRVIGWTGGAGRLMTQRSWSR